MFSLRKLEVGANELKMFFESETGNKYLVTEQVLKTSSCFKTTLVKFPQLLRKYFINVWPFILLACSVTLHPFHILFEDKFSFCTSLGKNILEFLLFCKDKIYIIWYVHHNALKLNSQNRIGTTEESMTSLN